MLRVKLVNIGYFVLYESTGITFIYLVKSEVFVPDVILLSRYILMLFDEINFEVSKSIDLVSTSFFLSSMVPLVSSFWVVKLFYMVSLSTKFTMLSSLELGLRIGNLFLMQ